MRTEPEPELVAALTRALTAEADEITVSPDARASLQARLDTERRRSSTRGRAGRRPSRARPRWLGPMAALVALGLVVVGLFVVTTSSLHRTATPGPAQSPSAVPTPGPTPGPTSAGSGRTASTRTGFRPSQPRVAWTVYRAGPDGLYADAAPARAPYDPVQAMEALFQQDPTVPGAEVVPGNGRNRVASLTDVDGVVHLDMAAVDDQTRPVGTEGAAQARRWVDAWVGTAASAFDGYKVLITVNGRPATLYGVVDTTEPLLEPLLGPTVELKHPATVYFPADAATVTSPVALAAMPGAVGDRLVVRDVADGEVVASVTADEGGGGRTILTSAPALDPGDYTVELVRRSGRTEAGHRFTVSGSAPSGARVPVTDPATTPVATTLIYYPGPDQHLLAEPRPRTTLTDAVAGISGEPAGEGASWPFGSLTLASVREDADGVVVDYAKDDEVRPGKPDTAVAAFWAQSLVHTVSAYEGRPTAVRVTLDGRAFRLFGLLDTTRPFTRRDVDTRTSVDLTLPTSVPTPGPLQVVGAVGADADHVTWYVVDRITRETLFQGNAAVAADRTYAFALPVPAGRYELRADAVTATGRVLASYGRSPEIT
ncbi:hypothetical protein GCM10022197_08580 [Microlunatus spumicola]|uniref:GerMN domain-containing protein n=1 Tax=Microlunatus spumicola TaxID=81499 RepID=A0ABP6WXM9_9ACTN